MEILCLFRFESSPSQFFFNHNNILLLGDLRGGIPFVTASFRSVSALTQHWRITDFLAVLHTGASYMQFAVTDMYGVILALFGIFIHSTCLPMGTIVSPLDSP